jgi:ABC-type hemin transport system ATPase subunit
VSFAIEGRRILGPVDLSLSPGEICGLIGPNGSGKPALVSMLASQAAPSTGAIRFPGRAIDRESGRR